MTRWFKSWDELGFQILVNLFLLFMLIMILVPMWRVAIMSITPLGYATGSTSSMWVPPNEWSFEAYGQLLAHPSFLHATLVSTIYQLGYAGAMAWAYNDNKNFPWSPNNLNVQAFATTHPCMFAP